MNLNNNFIVINVPHAKYNPATKLFNKLVVDGLTNDQDNSVKYLWKLFKNNTSEYEKVINEIKEKDIVLFYNKTDGFFFIASVKDLINEQDVTFNEVNKLNDSEGMVIELNKFDKTISMKLSQDLIKNGVIDKDEVLRFSELISYLDDQNKWDVLFNNIKAKTTFFADQNLIDTKQNIQNKILNVKPSDYSQMVIDELGEMRQANLDDLFVESNLFKCAVCLNFYPKELMNKSNTGIYKVLPICNLGCSELLDKKLIGFDFINKNIRLLDKAYKEENRELVNYIKLNVLDRYDIRNLRNEYLENKSLNEVIYNWSKR